jgi:hypothetical protein
MYLSYVLLIMRGYVLAQFSLTAFEGPGGRAIWSGSFLAKSHIPIRLIGTWGTAEW